MKQTLQKQLDDFDTLHKDRTTSVSRKEYHEFIKQSQQELLKAVVELAEKDLVLAGKTYYNDSREIKFINKLQDLIK